VRGAIDRGTVTFGQVFQLVPPVMLITMLPISIAGWGVREATMGLAFGYAGLMANEGVNISLLFGAVVFIVGVFGGLVWIFSPEKAAQSSESIKVPDENSAASTPHCLFRQKRNNVMTFDNFDKLASGQVNVACGTRSK
jgi:hypothetical protein